MPTAASIADVEVLLGVTTLSTASASARTERLLERAERTVLTELPGFTLGVEVDDDEATLEGDGETLLMLPNYPVRSVTSVTVDGVALPADSWTFNTLGELRRRAVGTGNPHTVAGGQHRWPDRGVDIVVVYSHGYAASATPGVIRDLVAELAAGRIVNPSQVAQESLGDRSVSHGSLESPNADGLNTSQLRRLRNWRRNRVASVRQRLGP